VSEPTAGTSFVSTDCRDQRRLNTALGLMYTVTSADKPRKLDSAPQCSVGAPCPTLVAGEHSLRLAYYLEDDRLILPWNGQHATSEAPGDSDDACAVVRFEGAYAHMFGPPNDEAFSGHPLASRGVTPYAVFEVEASSWIASLERMNAVHPHHTPARFKSYRHYIFSFHDTTFECVARAFSVSLFRGTPSRILSSSSVEA
jgi:hypothetical protein